MAFFGASGHLWIEVEDMAENLGVEIKTTAAYAPWMNGVNERNHAVTDQILEKIVKDQPDVPLDVALSMANMAKNTLHMHNGFSSYQLVFGANPKLPNVLSDEPPALEGVTTSETVMTHLQALHTARKSYIAAESSEKIRRA